MSDTDDKKIELWVVKDLRIGDVIQASLSGVSGFGDDSMCSSVSDLSGSDDRRDGETKTGPFH